MSRERGVFLQGRADENSTVAALVDRKAGGELVPVFRNKHPNAGVAALFFIGGRQEDHVAVQVRVGPLQGNKRCQICSQHALVIDGAAAVQISVLNHSPKGIDSPSRLVHRYHVQVRHQQQRFRRIGHRRAAQPCYNRTSPGCYVEHFRHDAFLLEDSGDV